MPGYTFNEVIFHGVIFGISYFAFDWFLGSKTIPQPKDSFLGSNPLPQPKDSFMDLADFLYEKIKNREEEFSQCEKNFRNVKKNFRNAKKNFRNAKRPLIEKIIFHYIQHV